MRLIPLWALLLALLFGAAPAQAETLVIYEQGPMAASLHPFRLGESAQGLHLSPLLTERFGALDVETNELRLSFLEGGGEGPSTDFVLTLKEGLVWSDGRPVTPEDVSASFRRLDAMAGQPGAPASIKALRRSLFLLRDIRPVGKGRVGVSFVSPVRGDELPALLAPIPLTPAGVPDDALGTADAPTAAPFILQDRSDELLHLRANPRYHRGAPHVEGIELIVADPDALSLALTDAGSGEIALYVPLGLTTLSPDLVVRSTEARRFAYLGFNMREGSRFAALPDLRQVVAAIINRKDLLEVIPTTDPQILPVGGPYSPKTPLGSGRPLPAPNATQAEARLLELGFRRTGDNWRDAANRLLTFRIAVHEDFPGGLLAGKIISEQLQRAGIQSQVEILDREAFRGLLTEPRGDFDLILHEWLLDESEDVTELYSSRGRYNYLGYENADVDLRLARERQAQLASSRRLYRGEIEATFAADPPAVFLWQRHDTVAIRGDVGGVPPLDPYYVLRDVHRWYIGDAPEAEEPPTPYETPEPTAFPAPPTPTPTPDLAPAPVAAPEGTPSPAPAPAASQGDDAPSPSPTPAPTSPAATPTPAPAAPSPEGETP